LNTGEIPATSGGGPRRVRPRHQAAVGWEGCVIVELIHEVDMG
jgi:hypothetical protein